MTEQEANGIRTLALDRGGTHIIFEGKDDVTKQDLYNIADKLQALLSPKAISCIQGASIMATTAA